MTDKESLAGRIENILRSVTLASHIPSAAEAKNVSDEVRVLMLRMGEHEEQVLNLMCERNELKAELNQCLTAHAMLNDKICVIEDENANLKAMIEIMRDMDSKGMAFGESVLAIFQERDELKAVNTIVKNALRKERDELKAQLAEYKYTPQSYDEMWERVKETVNENDELKARVEKLENQLSCNYMHTNIFCTKCGWMPPTTDKIKAGLE